MRQTTKIGLALYDASDKMNVTGANNSLNHNMELIDAEVAKKMSAPEGGTAGQVLTKTEGGFAWQDAAAGSGASAEGAVLYTLQELTEEQQNQARANIAAADAAALSALNTQINGAAVENSYSDVCTCTAGTGIDGNSRFFDLSIPAGTEYSFSATQDGVFGGNIPVYEVYADNSKALVSYLTQANGWSFTAVAAQEVRRFSLYSTADRIVGSGAVALNVRFVSDTVNSVEKRLAAMAGEVDGALAEVETLRLHSDELYGIINGTGYTKAWSGTRSVVKGASPSGDTVITTVDIPTGMQYSVQLECADIIKGNVTVYEIDAGGSRSAAGVLKSRENYAITVTAKADVVGLSIYTDNANVIGSGEIRLNATMEVAARESMPAQLSRIDGEVQEIGIAAERGSEAMGYRTLFRSACYEIGASVNNDNNATYVYHDFVFDVASDECIGVRFSAVENATSVVIGYVDGSEDGTEYTNLLSFRTAGAYHAYPTLGCTKVRVRLYPSTSGGLDDVTAKFRDLEIFASNDGCRRLAYDFAPRAWDVPGYYLRGGYMDGKVEEILSRVDASGGDCDTFFFITDMHWRWNSRVSPALVGYLSRRLNIERLFFGGDWADGYSENGILAFKEAFSGKIYNVLGNHDYMDYWCKLGEDENSVKGHTLTPAMASYQLISRTDDIVLGDSMYGYYHVDNPTNKMRYIVLQVYTDESAVHLEQAQLDWLDGVLSSMPEGYLAVVFAHLLGEVGDDGATTLNGATGAKVAAVCDKYAAKVACMFNGHMHRDGMCKTDGGIPVFVTSCDCWSLAELQEDTQNPRVDGTRTEQVIEAVIVDRTNRKVSAVRIGCPARVVDDTSVEVREQTFVAASE